MANYKSLLDLAFEQRFPESSDTNCNKSKQSTRNRTRCTVWRPKKYPPYFVLSGEPYEKEDVMTNYHEWEDGYCKHCHKTLEEVTKPKPIKKLKRGKGVKP